MSEPNSLPGTLGQPSEQDVVMNPPSMDDPASSTHGHSQDSGEGNKPLKRRFDEIEQDTTSETARPEVDAQRREEAE
ncbi:hypothetical protein CPC08DRAFT_127243 [Agrocybe pediades]|nr:hypothetical protein CPC08DRAFT_127243 [Agrocybe pediades]